ncbi:5-keto-2-deoxygluconokinase [[Actinomadura] parvosata subsp. kistnae]|uniref:5-dehydro-2-deoxygluconokinase n=1 Tax=[Actinomadura] parvosata subsp. kistnae TaxID=1909395 RepID=A0A1V0A747_9ACTN|nr:5-dehydro-2-deoxygluconokinase [Nonomuraea sp. ATCC 55076]AQZ66037.1 5-dehydro-2-deoxygluconokinase [Nonomuraea sp. ATCC 55076]SPL97511.1 5-keto-2-deoxygluconokinase [Actinomadura parvosata subsp. kistnae]
MYDLITIGRSGVDVYPLQTGVGLADVETFGKFLGGSPTNVAVAAARHGLRSAVITGVGADPFGQYVRRAIRGFGVDDAFVHTIEGRPTPVTFCEIFPPDHFPIYFYRGEHPPDLQLTPSMLDLDAIAGAGLFWFSLTGLSQEPSAAAHAAALSARTSALNPGLTVFDLDYRAVLWESREAAHEAAQRMLPRANVAVGNLEEVETAVGVRDPEAAAQALLDAGVRLAIVKMGPEGVFARTSEESALVEPMEVKVVNGIGAGDAFGGALCLGLLRGWPLERTLRFANAAGAFVAARLACADAMPSTSEVDDLLNGASC